MWLEALPRASIKHPLCSPSRTAPEKKKKRERDAEDSYELTERDAYNGPSVETMGLRRRWGGVASVSATNLRGMVCPLDG